MTSTAKSIWCGDCAKGWVRKKDFEKHFELQFVKDGGKLVENICFNRKRKICGYSLAEAQANKKIKTIDFTPQSNISTKLTLSQEPSTSKQEPLSSPLPECSTLILEQPDKNEPSTSKQEPLPSPLPECSTLILEQPDKNEPEFSMLHEEPAVSISHETSVYSARDVFKDDINKIKSDQTTILSKIDVALSAIGRLSEQVKENSNKTISKEIDSHKDTLPSIENYQKLVDDIKSASCNSMKQILKNKLVEGIFEIEESENCDSLICVVCKNRAKGTSSAKLGFSLVDGTEYSVWESGIKRPMSKSFSNLKQKIATHLESHVHINCVTAELEDRAKVYQTKDKIFRSMRQLAYFCLKSNLPFNQFESLLATANVCGLQLGDKNHSREFMLQFLNLVDTELIKKTVKWVEDQEHITITLDIGTVYGFPLLAVLFIANKTAKLANILPLISKRGADVAQTCYDACKLADLLDEQVLKDKVVGVTADGAFAKGNSPFKVKISELFEKELVIRWDLLHLINRAHIEARGKVDEDDEDIDELENDVELNVENSEERNASLITELIHYIQSGAKKFRTGLEYAKMKALTHGVFKRPKIWSNTRMVVYEFDMVQRFLENALFMDIPTTYLLTAQCHCLILFALKIILKNVQRTDLPQSYVKFVILDNAGMDAMKLASQVATDMYLNNQIEYLKSDQQLIEKTNISGNPKKTFCQELLTYVEDKRDFFVKHEEPQDRITRSTPFTILQAKAATDTYTELLWGGIKRRIKLTDLSDSPCAFSEAPAEGIFSIYSRVTKGRESLTIDHAVALTRVATHGPPPATKGAASLAKAAMANFKSKYGERYCTHLWQPGCTSSTIKNIKSKTWDW